MKMPDLKQKFEACSFFVSLLIGGICLFISFLLVGVLMLAVMAISFALSVDLYKSFTIQNWSAHNIYI